MAQETLYELYFAQVAGHIIDVRDIQHIGPTEQHTNWEATGDDGAYGDVPAGYQFQYAMKGTGVLQTFEVTVPTEEEAEAAREVLVAAHAKLWLPYPDAPVDAATPVEAEEEKANDATNPEATVECGNIPVKTNKAI